MAKGSALNTLLLVGGGALLLKLLGAFKSADEMHEEQSSGRFRTLWELLSSRPLQDAVARGLVWPYQVDEVSNNPAAMAGIVRDLEILRNAPANWYAWDDDERAAVGAIAMRSTYPELLLFANLFAIENRIPVGQFLLSFMQPAGMLGDSQYIAPIVDHVERLRPHA